jgi:hypothetical protein
VELEIPEMLAAVLQGQVGAQSPLGLQLGGYGAGSGVRIVSSQHFDGHSLNLLFQLGMAAGARDLVFQLLALDNLNGEPLARPIPSLELMVPALIEWLRATSSTAGSTSAARTACCCPGWCTRCAW